MTRRPGSSVRLSAEPLEDRTTPATFTVTNANDAGPGSLRAEIALATADGNADTIDFTPGLSGALIYLKTIGDSSVGPSGFLITTPITIQGTAQTIGIQPPVVPGVPTAPDMRLFTVTGSGSLTLENLTLSDGVARGGSNPNGGSDGLGGAVYNQGTLTLAGCTVMGNKATGGSATGGNGAPTGSGGGFTSGPFVNPDALSAGTRSPANAGYTGGGGSGLVATPFDLPPNLPGGNGWGGAVFNFGGTVTVVNSTFTGNTAAGGEGNSTAVGQGAGGAIMNLDGALTLVNDTFSGDHVRGGALIGGEVFNFSLAITIAGATPAPAATTTVANTIVDGVIAESGLDNQQQNGTATINATGPNIISVLMTNIGGTVTGTPFTVAQPNLGPLTYNFGPTYTMLPNTGSPAIDAGSNTAAAAAGLTTDQRGAPFVRVYGDTVDIGAVEVQPIPPSPPNYFPLPPPPAPLANPDLSPLVVSGQPNGWAQVFTPQMNGFYSTSPAATLDPFGTDLGGNVRVAVGDVNGDGIPDYIFATGPGVPFQVAVVSGADNTTLLVQPFSPFEASFTGGGFVSAGVFQATGRADFVVSPDEGGGPRVSIFSLAADGTVGTVANFYGIDDPNFRGGVRTAVGDVNGDGVPDLIVAAGFGGGPRVTVFNGKTLAGGNPVAAANFFAFPQDANTLRNGVYVSAGDVNGDGFADLIFGGGPGGGPRVLILSGQLISTGNIAGAENAPIANFFAGSTLDRGGIRVAAVNADGDALADVALGSGAGDAADVQLYLGTSLTSGQPSPFVSPEVFGGVAMTDGVYVG